MIFVFVSRVICILYEAELNNKVLYCDSQVNGHLNLHEWYGWCGHSVDDLRREPLFPFKPHVCKADS